jgi:hypothetical protein
MSTFLNNDTPEGVGGLFFDVMSHSHKFGDVTTDFGAAAFNRDFLVRRRGDPDGRSRKTAQAKPLPEHAAEHSGGALAHSSKGSPQIVCSATRAA